MELLGLSADSDEEEQRPKGAKSRTTTASAAPADRERSARECDGNRAHAPKPDLESAYVLYLRQGIFLLCSWVDDLLV